MKRRDFLSVTFCTLGTRTPPWSKSATLWVPPGTPDLRSRILSWMEGLAGKHLIISQMCRVTGNELNGFVSAFGKHPGMIVYDLWQDATQYYSNAFVQTCIDHWNAGGLVGMSAFIPNPATNGLSCLDKTPVDATQAVTPGTETYNRLIGSLDLVAAALQRFKDAGMVVVFRPLFEMDIPGAFWWNQNNFTGAQFGVLWRMVYHYLTITKGLDNLIFMFAANGGPGVYTYVGDDVVGGVGMDAYTNDPTGPAYRNLSAQLHAQAPSKFRAFTEFGSGNPTKADPNFDALAFIANVKRLMPEIVYINAWSNWDWARYRNAAAAMADPYVLCREILGRPT